MSTKICPLMSRPVVSKNAHGNPISEIHYVDCYEANGNCQLWTQVYTTEGAPISGCAFEIAAHKTQDGKYAV